MMSGLHLSWEASFLCWLWAVFQGVAVMSLMQQKLLDRLQQQLLVCPGCKQECEETLMLPCSHIMCGRCVAAGEEVAPGRTVCSVVCPGCPLPVELPCWTWSSATSCLPKHPIVSPVGMVEVQNGSSAASSSDVDLQEEEMEQSVFGLGFALDPSTVPPCLHLSTSSLTVTFQKDSPPPSDSWVKVTSDPWAALALPQVCADVVFRRGQYYWEVDVCDSSVYRIGVSSPDGSGGWWLERRGSSFSAVYDGSREPLGAVPPQIKSLGVFLNIGGGALSFHNPLTREHLATLPTRFPTAGVVPALGLGQGRLRLRRGLPPPPSVFLSRDSAYRGPRGAGGVRWRREIPFRSVRKVIQKFEELAGSDSGLVSSSGSSCSTLAE